MDKKYIDTAKELEVYKKAFQLSLEIHKISSQFPKSELYALTDQLRRATRSICANLAEGFAKQKDSSAEFGRFVSMGIGSCAEIDVWLSYAESLGYMDPSLAAQFRGEYDIVHRMLRKLKSNIG